MKPSAVVHAWARGSGTNETVQRLKDALDALVPLVGDRIWFKRPSNQWDQKTNCVVFHYAYSPSLYQGNNVLDVTFMCYAGDAREMSAEAVADAVIRRFNVVRNAVTPFGIIVRSDHTGGSTMPPDPDTGIPTQMVSFTMELADGEERM